MNVYSKVGDKIVISKEFIEKALQDEHVFSSANETDLRNLDIKDIIAGLIKGLIMLRRYKDGKIEPIYMYRVLSLRDEDGDYPVTSPSVYNCQTKNTVALYIRAHASALLDTCDFLKETWNIEFPFRKEIQLYSV